MFYTDDGMVVALDPAWLQGAFSAMVAIFERVGLQTNVDRLSAWPVTPVGRGPETGPRRGTGGE